jgi:hypothetical protein
MITVGNVCATIVAGIFDKEFTCLFIFSLH